MPQRMINKIIIFQQPSNGQNMVNSFDASLSGGEGVHNLCWLHSSYSSSDISQQTGGEFN
jgi:hypothetical protein